ncbi:enoyl-CoA hydratase/isomerase family protein [Achromobacter aegrifaciens]
MDWNFYKSDYVGARRVGAIVQIQFTREDRRNALNSAMLNDLVKILDLLRDDAEIAAVIFSGGDRYFSAGADYTDGKLFDKSSVINYRRGLLARAEVCRQIVSLPQVTISAIEGFAIGGGLSVALACDFRVMSESAYLWVPELDRGSIYAWNSIPRLMALGGLGATRRLLYLGEKADASISLGWGLADFLATPGTANARAMELAAKVAAKPRLALEICKRNVNQADSLLTSVIGYAEADQAALCSIQ